MKPQTRMAVLAALLLPLAALADVQVNAGQLHGTIPGTWSSSWQQASGSKVLTLTNDEGARLVFLDVMKSSLPVGKFLSAFIAAGTRGKKVVSKSPEEPQVGGTPRSRVAAQAGVLMLEPGRYTFLLWFAYEVKGGRQVAILASDDATVFQAIGEELQAALMLLNQPESVKRQVRAQQQEDEEQASQEEDNSAGSSTCAGLGNACGGAVQCCSGYCYAGECRQSASDTSTYRSVDQLYLQMHESASDAVSRGWTHDDD